jgi:hypothetical protein
MNKKTQDTIGVLLIAFTLMMFATMFYFAYKIDSGNCGSFEQYKHQTVLNGILMCMNK